jgi:hypothetical protein
MLSESMELDCKLLRFIFEIFFGVLCLGFMADSMGDGWV